MKLTYTEYRPAVNRTSVEVLAELKDADDILTFRNAVLKEIDVCMENDAQELAHKLLDWHKEVYDKGLTVGQKLVYPYGTLKDPVGTYELTD
jgi:hypothetical protein